MPLPFSTLDLEITLTVGIRRARRLGNSETSLAWFIYQLATKCKQTDPFVLQAGPSPSGSGRLPRAECRIGFSLRFRAGGAWFIAQKSDR